MVILLSSDSFYVLLDSFNLVCLSYLPNSCSNRTRRIKLTKQRYNAADVCQTSSIRALRDTSISPPFPMVETFRHVQEPSLASPPAYKYNVNSKKFVAILDECGGVVTRVLLQMLDEFYQLQAKVQRPSCRDW